jgi:hypothetical protein
MVDFEFKPTGSAVVASVASTLVERAILGNEPLFRVPAYHLEHPAELIAYALLGIVGGAGSRKTNAERSDEATGRGPYAAPATRCASSSASASR